MIVVSERKAIEQAIKSARVSGLDPKTATRAEAEKRVFIPNIICAECGIQVGSMIEFGGKGTQFFVCGRCIGKAKDKLEDK